ncbi:PREDICTED: endocuticle structural glycoprotein SgAbd-1-like [Nicrophorus vespilloides]|uniref:Endocuticle structural glycoprotein SgAbd-1-like n=1 Tax=Nicrophorus vespilloides TaxID=110193 RepID=A0ABM1NG18_NICVS|nr:PREDICTED: endocuticle structural glycoprotein SgAbd-1-like [Nicrophorus vespilloides]
MNSMIVLLAVFGCALAQYRPIPAQQPGQQIAIVRQDSTLNPDGSYQWNYETANGIAAQEQGAQKAVGNEAGTAAQGSFSYTSPDGTPISLQYTADENGFQPQGAHLPVAPEIPAAIQKALAWIAAHPSAEDGPRPGNRRF